MTTVESREKSQRREFHSEICVCFPCSMLVFVCRSVFCELGFFVVGPNLCLFWHAYKIEWDIPYFEQPIPPESIYICALRLYKKKFGLFNNIDYKLNLHNVLSVPNILCTQKERKNTPCSNSTHTQKECPPFKLPAASEFSLLNAYIFGFLLNWNGLCSLAVHQSEEYI